MPPPPNKNRPSNKNRPPSGPLPNLPPVRFSGNIEDSALRSDIIAFVEDVAKFKNTFETFEKKFSSEGATDDNQIPLLCPAMGYSSVLKKDDLEKYSLGIVKFNTEGYKKGIQHLIRNKFIRDDKLCLSYFFRNEPGLNKKVIGEYLGDDQSGDFIECFVDLFDFSAMDFVEALRDFLASFCLPGESQKIDRIMQKFASRYHQLNPAIFGEEDTVYILAFSIIMLNTDQHNPNVKNKMSFEDFKKNNRGIDKGGEDLPEEFLLHIFHSIKSRELKFPKESEKKIHEFFNPEKNGWLRKQGGRVKTWKDRYFVLTGNVLYYFKRPDEEPCGIIPLEDLEVRVIIESKLPCFELFHQTEDVIKSAKRTQGSDLQIGHHLVYRFQVKSQQEMSEWVEAIQNNIKPTPLYALLTSKKNREASLNVNKRRPRGMSLTKVSQFDVESDDENYLDTLPENYQTK